MTLFNSYLKVASILQIACVIMRDMNLLSFTILFSSIALTLGAISLRLHLKIIRYNKKLLDEAMKNILKEEIK